MTDIPASNQGRHAFDRSGLAALSDFESEEWLELFRILEKEQSDFLAKEALFRSPEYTWTRDPLHTWSRIWEYPYVYHHLRQFRTRWKSDAVPQVIDVGSGVTFFPFSVARLGYQVTCADIDPVCAKDIPRAAALAPQCSGMVDFRLIEGASLPFRDDEVDVVICVSVLEHIRDPEETVTEIARVLKPAGLLILTIDLDLRGDAEMGVVGHRKLIASLLEHFSYLQAETTIHPKDVLDTCTGPCAYRQPLGMARIRFLIKQRIIRLLGGKSRALLPFFLTVQGFVMSKSTSH